MKNIIKKLLRESLLTEKLTDVDSDVDLIYDRYFKDSVDRINQTGMLTRDMFMIERTNTVILKSPECVEAHRLNMCSIIVNDLASGNLYSASQRKIGVSFGGAAVKFILNEYGGNLHEAINDSDGRQKQMLENEFTEARVKGSIHHELAHWLDDTLNNRHIQKTTTNNSNELSRGMIKGKPVNTSKIELQGQIHNVKQLFNKHKDNWDSLTFSDLLRLSPPLSTVNNELSKGDRTQWIRDLKTRMHREGLLGKNMANS